MGLFNVQVEMTGWEDFEVESWKDARANNMHQMANEAINFWNTLAGQRLKSSRDKYQKAIKLEGVTSESFTIVLDGGGFTYNLEMGTSPYYMNVPKGKHVPLNLDNEIVFTSPEVWRTGTGKPWLHPGFPGFRIMEDVITEIEETLAPKYIDEAIEEL